MKMIPISDRAQSIKIKTEYGIARQVFVDSFELKCVTDVDISYGVNNLPKVRIELFISEVKIDDECTG